MPDVALSKDGFLLLASTTDLLPEDVELKNLITPTIISKIRANRPPAFKKEKSH
jgi:hypothetical protein